MVKIIVGMMGSSVAKGSTSMATVEQVQTFLHAVSSHGVTELDTARVYNSGRSEELLGLSNARSTFSISTKAPAFSPGSLSEAAILSNASASLAALQQDKLDIYYLHGPDPSTPLDQQCRAIAQLHRANRFARFGVSNLSAADVRAIHDICVREGVPPPTVYQGGYNPLNRRAEEGLFPTLRRLGMAFYAFSPLAGGALAKSVDEVVRPKEGTRFAEMPVFGTMYAGEEMVRALRRQTELCEKYGFGIMEGTLRWFMHHSPLGEEDGFILGASSTEQIEASLQACEKPPLPEEVVAGWDQLWEAAREKAPEYYPK